MGRARHPKGFRHIRVGDTSYLWCFRPGAEESRLVVCVAQSLRQRLEIVLVDWRDPWIDFPYAPPNEPACLTPQFVREAILAARAEGLEPDPCGPDPCRTAVLEYRQGHFRRRTDGAEGGPAPLGDGEGPAL